MSGASILAVESNCRTSSCFCSVCCFCCGTERARDLGACLSRRLSRIITPTRMIKRIRATIDGIVAPTIMPVVEHEPAWTKELAAVYAVIWISL